MRFSGLKILTEGLKGNSGWGAHWRDPEPAQNMILSLLVAVAMVFQQRIT